MTNEQTEVAYKLAKQFITLSIAVKVVERDLAIFERGLSHFKLGHMYTELFHQTIIAIRKNLQRVKKEMHKLNVRVFEEQATNGANVDPYIAKVFTQTVQFLEELGHEVVEDTPVIDEDTHFNMKIRFWTAAMYKELNELARQLETTVTE